jgi:hypothetical protein
MDDFAFIENRIGSLLADLSGGHLAHARFAAREILFKLNEMVDEHGSRLDRNHDETPGTIRTGTSSTT